MKGYRTVIFNVIMVLSTMVTLISGIETKDDVTVLANGVDLVLQGITIIWGVGNVWLRVITDSPIFSDKKKV